MITAGIRIALVLLLATGCGGHGGAPSDGGAGDDGGPGGGSDGPGRVDGGAGPDAGPPQQGPAAGNPDGHCAVPAEAQAEDSSQARTVVGTGTPESCTGDKVVAAVALGGVITFNCGSE